MSRARPQQESERDLRVLYVQHSARNSIERLTQLVDCVIEFIQARRASPAARVDAYDTLRQVELLLMAVHAYAMLQMETFERKEAHDGH